MKRISLSGFISLILLMPLFGQVKKHTVLAGETLYSIARFYEVPVDLIKTQNKLSGNSISAGQVLIIPGTVGENVTTNPPDKNRHVVQKGETMFSISKKYGLKADELRVLNRLPSNAISIGDTLWLAEQSPATTQKTDTTTAAIKMVSTSSRFHEVKKGETLFRISQLYNTTVNELIKLNQLASQELSVGQKLRILAPQELPVSNVSEQQLTLHGRFVTYVWKEGDSIENQLNQYKMTNLEWQALNPGLDTPSTGDQVVLFEPASAQFRNPYAVAGRTADTELTRFSLYPESRIGQPLVSGILLSRDLLIIGHPVLRLGTIVWLHNTESRQGVFAQVMDRVPSGSIVLAPETARALKISKSSGENATLELTVFSHNN
jgi:LysM repeat protein